MGTINERTSNTILKHPQRKWRHLWVTISSSRGSNSDVFRGVFLGAFWLRHNISRVEVILLSCRQHVRAPWSATRLQAADCVCLQGMSETFSTLHGLVHKGVNVVMDIPYELWNETSAEVADLKKQVLSHRVKWQKIPVESLRFRIKGRLRVSVWRAGGAVRGGDWRLVQREPGGGPDHLLVWKTRSKRAGHR